MNAETFEHVADLVRERPYLSPVRAAVFISAMHDHANPSTGCTGGPHCWIEMKAREVLQLTGGVS
jgi:hypothetical protein